MVSSSADLIHRVLTQPARDLVDLVDDLLAACREHALDLDWQIDRCRVRSGTEDWRELPDVPLRKSAFRSILARLAVLCNERRPGSCSPYGGHGEITVGSHPATVFHVVFTNTPSDQRLQLTHDRPVSQIGGVAMPSPLVEQGDPMLIGLLAEVPRIRRDLWGWAEGHLVPALAAFPDDATGPQIATALADLRQVLRERADIDPWLGDIANLRAGEYPGDPHAMTWPSQLNQRVELPEDRVKNRTIVEQARQLAQALKATSKPDEGHNAPPPPSNPGAK